MAQTCLPWHARAGAQCLDELPVEPGPFCGGMCLPADCNSVAAPYFNRYVDMEGSPADGIISRYTLHNKTGQPASACSPGIKQSARAAQAVQRGAARRACSFPLTDRS